MIKLSEPLHFCSCISILDTSQISSIEILEGICKAVQLLFAHLGNYIQSGKVLFYE